MLNSKYSNHSLSFFSDLPPYVITMSFDSAEWRKDFIEKAALGSSYTEMSYYNPKAEYGTLTKTYFIYCQPIVLFLQTVWLIVLIRALWTSEYVKKFGFCRLFCKMLSMRMFLRSNKIIFNMKCAMLLKLSPN